MADAGQLVVHIKADTSQFHSGLAEAHKGIAGLGGSLANVGKAAAIGIGAAGGALAAFGGMALNAAGEFEQAMSEVKAVSGATADEISRLDALAMQLGKDTVFSAKEAANGIAELVKGGVPLEDILNGAATAALNLATAGGVGLADAAEIASNAMAMFGLKGSDMAHVADQIAGAANASSLSVMDFKFSLAASGAVARTAGQTFDDLAQAIAIMGKEGMKGSDAGTSLKTMLMNLQPTTKKQIAEFNRLGITMEDGTNKFIKANGQFKGMAEIAGVLEEALDGATDAEKMLSLEAMFGSDAIRAAAILTRQGAKGFEEMAAGMNKVTAASVGAEKLNNFKGSMEQLKGSWDTLLITIGKPLLPVIRGAVDGVTGALNTAIGEWDKILKGEGAVGSWVQAMRSHISSGDWGSVASLLGATIGEQLGNLGTKIMPFFPDWAQLVLNKIRLGQYGEIAGVLGTKIGEGLAGLGEKIGGIWEGIKAALDKPLPPEVTGAANSAGSKLGKALADALKSAGGSGGTGNIAGMLLGEAGQALLLMSARGKELAEAFKSGFIAEMTAAGIVIPEITLPTIPEIPGLKGIADAYKTIYDVSKGMDWARLSAGTTDMAKAIERLNDAMKVSSDILIGQWKIGMDGAVQLFKDLFKGVDDTDKAMDPALKGAIEAVQGAFGILVTTVTEPLKGFLDAVGKGFDAAALAIQSAAAALERWNKANDLSGGVKSDGGAANEQNPPKTYIPDPWANNPPNIPDPWTNNAAGGIITRPILSSAGWIGEAGPEAIVPLDQLSGGRGGVTNINLPPSLVPYSPAQLRDAARQLSSYLAEYQRLGASG